MHYTVLWFNAFFIDSLQWNTYNPLIMSHAMVTTVIFFILKVIILGITIWLAIKVVDRENSKNNIKTALAWGLFYTSLGLLPLPILPVILNFIMLIIMFKTYELGIWKSIFAFIIMVVLIVVLLLGIGLISK